MLKQQPDLQVLLTDYYPNHAGFARLQSRFPGKVSSHPASVDARRVPAELRGFRSMFTGFHHFQPAEARAILADAVTQGQAIGIFEATRRDMPSLLAMLLSPLIVLLSSPFIKPFQLSRLFWTDLLPALPLLVAWDGMVSCLRTYTPQELRAMVTTIPGHEQYNWLIGEERVVRQAAPVTYLIGWPRRHV